MKFVIFTIFAMIAVTMAALQAGEQKTSALECMPLSLPCRQTSDCCRHLECVKHANICVKQTNPSEDDNRPVGPNIPYYLPV